MLYEVITHELDEEALVQILTRPKNALVRQYQRLFEFENVKLEFTEGALHGISRQAIERKAGARGLRSILEQIMLDVMYEIPSQNNIKKCIITDDVVAGKVPPEVVLGKKAELARITSYNVCYTKLLRDQHQLY